MADGRLIKGQNVSLAGFRLAFQLVTTPNGGVDTSALLLSDRGKVRDEPDFVFYNQPSHPASEVRLRTEGGLHRLEMDLRKVEADVERVLVAASVDAGGMSRYERAELIVTDLDTDAQLYQIPVVGESNEASMVLAEVYRRDGAWKLRAVSQGYDVGLAGLATDYGIIVDPSDELVPAESPNPPYPTPPSPSAPADPAPADPAPADPAPPPVAVAPVIPAVASAASRPPPNSPPREALPATTPPQVPPMASAATNPAGGVSYVRPHRPSPPRIAGPARSTSPLAAPRPPAPVAGRSGRPVTSDPAGPPSMRQRRPANAAAPTAQSGAASAWAHGRRRCRDDVIKIAQVMVDSLAAFAETRPNVDAVIKELDSAHDALRAAWKKRFAKHAVPATPTNSEPWDVAGEVATPGDWSRAARDLAARLGDVQILLTSDSRRNYRESRAREYQDVVGRLPAVRARVRQNAWDAMAAAGPGLAAEAARAGVRSWVPIAPPLFPIGPLLGPLVESSSFVRGFGPTWIMVGTAQPSSISFTTTRPSTRDGERTHLVALPSNVRFPVVIDLDRTGGYVTETPRIIESTALALLAALGPGQVKLDVFDPERLGQSANFLYGLGDAAEKVIGRKVRTTAKELADLLVEIEEHITFVTQKYLQGAYDTLTAYNHASGDVAEPYRLLIVYDYPSGFSRDDHYDKEQLDRFGKILATGRRCGVFTLIVRSKSIGESDRVARILPWLESRGFDPTVLSAGLDLDQRTGALLRSQDTAASNRSTLWLFDPAPALTPDAQQSLVVHIERGLRRAGDVQVLPDRVSELARLGMDREAAKGTREREPVVAAFDPVTWWQGTSAEHVTAVVGRLGATDTAQLRLDSQTASSVLIGGRPGSGKSVLLHSLIMSLVQRYGPDELALYLIDFKEGVEFKQYATGRLPQAKVVAIESEREFGVAVLDSLANAIVQRGGLFRADGSGEQANIGQYRLRTGQPMARIVLIIDEFQVLFDRDDKIGSRAAELLERVLRTGRAFGVHVVLASQTIAGMPALGRHLPNLIPTRVVLQSADADSRLLLSDDNADARLLSRPGEAILNTAGGQKDANQRFQSTYWDPEDRAWVLDQLRLRAVQEGRTDVPIVFEGSRGSTVDDVEVQTFATDTAKAISLPLGTSMNLSGPVRADLRREPGTNLLLVVDDPGPLTVALVVLARAGVRAEVLDFGGADDDGATRLAAATAGPTTTVSRRREVRNRLNQFAAVVDERIQLHDYSSPPAILVIHGMHRAREFDPAGEFDDESESGLLKRICRDGPEVGVHVVIWIDKKASVDRRLSYEVLREFGLRVCGPASREDSLALIDSDEAQGLHPGQAVFDDHDQGKHQRVRLFVSPEPEWSVAMIGGAQ